MRFDQNWEARVKGGAGETPFFPAHVPGNVQQDYGEYMGFGDIFYSDNFEKFIPAEGFTWEYRTRLDYKANAGERCFFVTEGIDYIYDVCINGKTLISHEGMFTKCEADITDIAAPGDILTVTVYPHPKREDAPVGRDQADHSVKPPVCYEWDWHPRLLVSGIWNDTYIETRTKGYIRSCEPFYTLSDDLSRASVRFEIDCDSECSIELFDAEGHIVGSSREFALEKPVLWWCNGQGNAYLYRYEVRSEDCVREGYIGFRKIELVMNSGAWIEPVGFPKSRSVCPIQLVLNGRRIFAKGSNWVSPEIFEGRVNAETYQKHIALAKNANMNIFRCWGGSGINKKAFYDECDRNGIMLWVEFPLACNAYPDDAAYLSVLEQEGRSIIRSLRSHASVVLWCGGNELFNNWSRMTDQSLPLRLLDKLCYEEDISRPYIMTSPLFGMGHGGYTFYDYGANCDCFTLFRSSNCTAYTEFGVSGIVDRDKLEKIIPPDELFPIGKTKSWIKHHAFEAWGDENWLGYPTLERYAPDGLDTLDKVIEVSQWLQCEGYKAIFEEARRQQPYCSMAINWCFCEPWPCAVNNSLVAYPTDTKKAYYAVRESLRPVLFSAGIPKFEWHAGERFSADIWLLNDTAEKAGGKVSISLTISGREIHLLDWDAEASEGNISGPTINLTLPDIAEASTMTLKLTSGDMSSEYKLRYRPLTDEQRTYKKILNM